MHALSLVMEECSVIRNVQFSRKSQLGFIEH